MQKVLDKANAGISMNQLTYQLPDAQYITTSRRDYLFRLRDAFRAQEKKAATGDTHLQRAGSWHMWEQFLSRCGWNGSKFLDECTTKQTNDLLCRFA